MCGRITAASLGWCYLLHMSRPLGNLTNPRGQAQHYTGYADDPAGDGAGLERRIAEHLAGRGAKITRAAVAQGITIELVCAWRAPLSFEQQLKRRKEAPRLCPICCREHGMSLKRAIAPAVQLALPFAPDTADDPFPTPPVLAMDRYEIIVSLGWQARRAAPALAEEWDAGLL